MRSLNRCKVAEHYHKNRLQRFGLNSFDTLEASSPGIYVFWNNRVCIYVGSTDRPLRQRLREHWVESHNDDLGKWISVYGKNLRLSLEIFSSEGRSARDLHDEIRRREQILIDCFSPLTNKIKARRR